MKKIEILRIDQHSNSCEQQTALEHYRPEVKSLFKLLVDTVQDAFDFRSLLASLETRSVLEGATEDEISKSSR